MSTAWRSCSNCNRDILFGAAYVACTVSTCNRVRTGMVFCGLDCWDAHLPMARHREAFAEDKMAPAVATKEGTATVGGDARVHKPTQSRRRRVVPAVRRDPSLPTDTLVVVKAVKGYIKAAGACNTSDAVMDVLSEKLRSWCDRAIERAKEEGRKTVLDRDFTV